MKDIFGVYNIRARLSVGILVLAPFLLQVYLLTPAIREITTTIIVVLIIYPLSNLIIISSRRSGVKVIEKCFPDLMPAQSYLLPSNNTVDLLTKKRYHDFLCNKISGFITSDSDEEMKPYIESAVTWLICQTRDMNKFPLIHEENINFGFSYNLLGLKPYGIFITIANILMSLVLITLSYQRVINLNIATLIICIIISLFVLAIWIFMVNRSLVINCANKYARALLSACDSKEFE